MKKIYLLLIAPLFMGGYVFAQSYGQTFGPSGLIDPEFNSTGRIREPYSTTANMSGHTSILQPDGKIIMAGTNGSNTVTLHRYTINGTVDNGFGTNGKSVVTAATGNFLGDNYSALAVQPNGKIIFVTAGSNRIAMLRLKSNGTPDSSFGINGIRYAPAVASWSSHVTSVIIKTDGKILTGGIGVYNNSNHYYEVAQFLPNGVPDSSFATNGVFHYSCAGILGGCYSLALLPSGNIIAGGIGHTTIDLMLAVNLKPNGVIDSSYGTNGIAVCKAFLTDKALFCRVALQRDNKLLLIGYGNWSGNRKAIGLGRFKTDGKPDSSFAYLGTLTTTFENFADFVQNVSEQFDSTLVISGYSNNKFAMMRLKPNGVTDTTYGRLGKVLTAIIGNGGVVNYSFMQPDGKLVMTGTTKYYNTYNFLATRFVVNPQPKYNVLKGASFYDANSNGVKDAGEIWAGGVLYRIIKPNLDSITVQSSDGKFRADVLDTGSYVSNAYFRSPLYYGLPAPVNHLTSNATYFNTDSVTFYCSPIPGITDVCISLLPYSRTRPGSPAVHAISYSNVGTTASSGTITYIKDNLLVYSSASTIPTSVSGDTLRWRYNNLAPHASGLIVINMTLSLPPVVNIGDTIFSTASIAPDNTDYYPPNNFAFLTQIATNSYDPNNKLENHGGKIAAVNVAAGENLIYTINFQNTGNDTALNIFIRDTLTNMLDWNTLQMISASAAYQLTIDNGKCLWSFNSINLPDSARSEKASHGYLSFMIKPKSTIQVGEVIKNTAAIYFDYNLPIYTNTETTTVVADAQPLKLLSFTAKKEGKTNLLNWTSANEINVDGFEVERSPNSRDFGIIGKLKAQNTAFNQYSYTDNNPLGSPLSNSVGEGSGVRYYRLRMLDKDGSFTYSPVRMLINSGTYFVSIYPNPAKANLQVQIDSDKKAAIQLQILSLDGKMILSRNTTATSGSILRSIDISALPRGNYFLKVTIAEKEEKVIKFDKL